jgi:predicted transcriptional regulator
MENTTIYLTFAITALIAIAMLSVVGLKGFTGWLELKKAELESARTPTSASGTGNRIEIADLKERIRKLEAIAAGVDL